MLLTRRVLPAAAAALLAMRGARARDATGRLGAILQAGEVVIGVPDRLPPWSFINEHGRLDGAEIVLARQVADDLGVRPRLEPLAFNDRIGALQSGQVDLLCAVLVMQEDRVRRVAFAHSHGAFQPVLVVRAGSPVRRPADLAGQRFAGLAGGADIDHFLALMPPDAGLLPVPDFAASLAALLSGEAAAAVLPDFMLRATRIERPEIGLVEIATTHPLRYAMATRHGEDDLLRFLNTSVFLRQQDGRLAEIYETFFGQARPELPSL